MHVLIGSSSEDVFKQPTSIDFFAFLGVVLPKFLDQLSLTRVQALQLPADVHCSKTTLPKPVLRLKCGVMNTDAG